MSYVLHILQIKLWEWEGVKEYWDMQMQKGGPFKEAVDAIETAREHICELKITIELLNQQQ